MPSFKSTFFTWLHRFLPYVPSSISSRVYGALFGLHLGLGLRVSTPINKSERELTSSTGETFKASVLSTCQTYPKLPTTETHKNVRTIIVIHGLSSTANEDPRIVNFAEGFAAASPSNIVVVPYIEPLAIVDLSNDPIGAIQRSIITIRNNKELCPTGAVSISSACISAGFVIVAASRLSPIENPIDAFFLVGPHASSRTVLKHTLERKAVDDSRYALYAMVSSFIRPKDSPLAKMLAAYVHDDHLINLGRQSNEVDVLLEKYPEDAKEYKKIRDDGSYACELLQKLMDDFPDEIDEMSGISFINDVNVKFVSLIHSKTDEIVPPNESITLKNAWKNNKNTEVALFITSLLNHGDQEPLSPKDIPEIFRLIDCFSTFFRKVNRPNTMNLDKKVS